MITFTEKAHDKVKAILKEGQLMRIAVMGGGCSGLQYHIDAEDAQGVSGHDNILVFGDFDFRVVIDPKSMVYLAGSEVDYEEVFGGGRFVVNNPNASRTCGCGKSFS